MGRQAKKKKKRNLLVVEGDDDVALDSSAKDEGFEDQIGS